MISLTDPTGNKVTLNSLPKKIISLVPSQTELLHYLALEDEVTGITKFCIHPDEWFRSKQRVGGTKNIKFDIIEKLNPDLIIANKEENEESQIKFLQSKYPVYTSEIYNLQDAYQMMEDIGTLTGKTAECIKLITLIKNKHRDFKVSIITKKEKVAYLIWKEPLMAAGNNTFVNSLITELGWINISAGIKGRYPELSEELIRSMKPDLLLLSSEPFPFKEKDLAYFAEKFPDSKPVLVDGEMFSWYGSRLLKAFDYFKELIEQVEKEKHP